MVRDANKFKNVKHRTRSSAAGGNRAFNSPSGFHVGPHHAPDGSYLGKAKKIKANLIANAKVKAKYYRNLQREGVVPPSAQTYIRTKGEKRNTSDDVEVQDVREGIPEETDAQQQQQQHGVTYRFNTKQGSLDSKEGIEDNYSGESDSSKATAFDVRDQGRFAPQLNDQSQWLSAGKQQTKRAKLRAGPPPSTLPPYQSKRKSHDGATGPRSQQHNDESPRAKHSNTIKTASRIEHPESKEERTEARQRRTEMWNRKSGSVIGRQRGQPDLGARTQLLLERIKAQQQ